jgi:histone acetyltransferase (RNA polymerase elongator complex component)
MRIYPVFVPFAGCPQRCLFCDQQSATGQRAAPDPARVGAWLEKVLPAAGEGEIAFYGGSFSALPEQLQEAYLAVAGFFVERGRAGGIRVSTRPDKLGSEQVARLCRGGVTTVEIGCQSLDDAVLSTCLRGHASEVVARAVESCRAAQLCVGLQLMPGLPGASPDEAERSLRKALALQPDFMRIYPALVLEGTGLADLWRRGGYLPLGLEQAVEIVAWQLLLCQDAGVPVIRVGLQQQAELEQSVLAGPYHPAFGQLVRSRHWRWAFAAVVGGHGRLAVHPHDLSDALGHARQNLAWLQANSLTGEVRGDAGVCRGCFGYAGKIYPVRDVIPRGGCP